MRATLRLLASVKPGRYLEPGHPTGLTGLYNHPAPRSTLIYLYSSTLDALKPFPEFSVYRRSTEALTRHRLSIVEKVKPAGWDEWSTRARKTFDEHPDVFSTPEGGVPHDGGKLVANKRDGKTFVTTQLPREMDERLEEWDGEEVRPQAEGNRSAAERADQIDMLKARPGSDEKHVEWEQEPPLEAAQYVSSDAHWLTLEIGAD